MTGENAMRTAVITDSNSGITKEEARRLGLFLMPMIIDGEIYYEGENLTEAEFFEALKGGRDVTTSQPSPGEVLDLWDRVLEQGYDEIVYIPMSAGLSESCSTAKRLAEDYEGKVYVVDNHRVSVTQKSSALDAFAKVRGMKKCETKMLEAIADDIRERFSKDGWKLRIMVAGSNLPPEQVEEWRSGVAVTFPWS